MPTFLDTGKNYKWFVPTNVIFGSGAINQLADNLPECTNILIVTSNGQSAKKSGALDKVIAQLQDMVAGEDEKGNEVKIEYTIFNEIEPNPLKDTVMRGAQVAREKGCDLVLAIGGGSVMDAAKAICVMATNDGDLWDYVAFGTGKKQEPEYLGLPLVCITLTSGTGSESDTGAVITNPETNEKTAFFGEFPMLAICDPDLTKSVNPQFTAFQGFDALFHSTEVFIANSANLASDMVAKEAIRNIGGFLARAVKDGNDQEARERVAFASSLSSFSMNFGTCTSEHSLEHALSAYHQALPHGAGLIMISVAYYTHFIEKGCCPDRFVKMAKLLGNKDASEPMDFVAELKKLQEDCGVADLKMSDYGIQPDEFEKMAKNAMDCMGLLFPYDRVQLSVEDCVKIYQQSYK